MANETAHWAADGVHDATQSLVGLAFDFMLSTPFPESASPGEVPANEPFATLYTDVIAPFALPAAVGVLLIVVLLFAAVLPFAGLLPGGEYRVRKRGVQLVASVAGVVLWWGIFTVATRAVDAGVMMIAPSPEALTASTEGIVRLSVGTIGATLALALVGGVEALALLFIYAGRHVVLIMYGVFMPLLVAGWVAAPWRPIREMARESAQQFVPVLLMPFPVAFALRLGAVVDWTFGFGAVGDAVVTMSLWGVGIVAPIEMSSSWFAAPPKMKKNAFKLAGRSRQAGSAARRRVRRARRRDGRDRERD